MKFTFWKTDKVQRVTATSRIPFKENTPGDFYVEDGCCTSCDKPRSVAPQLFSYAPDGHCYVCKQPQSAAGTHQMLQAFEAQGLGCIRYKGSNRVIKIRLIAAAEGHQCDEFDQDLQRLNDEVKADRWGLAK
jgi:hypothetical protein